LKVAKGRDLATIERGLRGLRCLALMKRLDRECHWGLLEVPVTDTVKANIRPNPVTHWPLSPFIALGILDHWF
jgi:hypothetical protein